MKRILLGLAIAAVSFCFGSETTRAQDLSQLAKKTREQRMKVMQQKSVRVWNNDNMPRRPAGEGLTAATGMSATPPPNYPGAVDAEPPPPEELPPGADVPDLDAMRAQIKQGQQGVKGLEERLRLVEDELSLLQVQQASELSPDTQATLAAQIKEKNSALSDLRQDIDKAKKENEKLEKEFKAQGGTLEEKKK
jgi:hypothetical protein